MALDTDDILQDTEYGWRWCEGTVEAYKVACGVVGCQQLAIDGNNCGIPYKTPCVANMGYDMNTYSENQVFTLDQWVEGGAYCIHANDKDYTLPQLSAAYNTGQVGHDSNFGLRWCDGTLAGYQAACSKLGCKQLAVLGDNCGYPLREPCIAGMGFSMRSDAKVYTWDSSEYLLSTHLSAYSLSTLALQLLFPLLCSVNALFTYGSAPAMPGASFEKLSCSHRAVWPSVLQTGIEMQIQGTMISSDPNMLLCSECAEKCWIDMTAQGCKAVHFEEYITNPVSTTTGETEGQLPRNDLSCAHLSENQHHMHTLCIRLLQLQCPLPHQECFHQSHYHSITCSMHVHSSLFTTASSVCSLAMYVQVSGLFLLLEEAATMHALHWARRALRKTSTNQTAC